MAHYIEWSTRIYQVYLKYAAPEDIHVYSIDEVFIDATSYLEAFQMTGRQLARTIILDILKTTGHHCGSGDPNQSSISPRSPWTSKPSMSRQMNTGCGLLSWMQMSYRRLLWDHRPLTDFWRVDGAMPPSWEAHGLFTMGDIARCSLGGAGDYYNEELLYKLFGVNAELLIDHAWGWEPCTIADVNAYKPENKSVVSDKVPAESLHPSASRPGWWCGRWHTPWRWIWWTRDCSPISWCSPWGMILKTSPTRSAGSTTPARLTTDRYGRERSPSMPMGTADRTRTQYSSSAQSS